MMVPTRPPQRPSTARPQLERRISHHRPKSAVVPRPHQQNGSNNVEDARVTALMEKYGVADKKGSLISDNASAMKMRRILGTMLEDELETYRSIFEQQGQQSPMNRDASTATSVGRLDGLDLKTLKAERLLFQRLGFVEHAETVEQRITDIERKHRQADGAKMRKIMDRRIRCLRAQHRSRMAALKADLEEQVATTEKAQKAQTDAMAEAHYQERKILLSRTIRMATGDDVNSTVCICTNPFTCRHNKTASYRLRKPNPQTVRYRAAAERLRKFHRRQEAADYDAKADAIDNAERIAWTQHVEATALKVQLPKLIESQKIASHSLRVKHDAIIASMQEKHTGQLHRLEKVLGCEVEKLSRRLKQRVQDAESGRLGRDGLNEEERLLDSDSIATSRTSLLSNVVSNNLLNANDLIFGSDTDIQRITHDDFDEDRYLRRPLKRSDAVVDDSLAALVEDGHRIAPPPQEERPYLPPWDQPPIDGLDNSRPLLLV